MSRTKIPKINPIPNARTGITQQSFRNDANINTIVARFKRNGQPITGTAKQPMYGDFADMPSYQESLNRVIQAQTDFETLPAKIRKEFDNDPAKLIDFLSNPDNTEKARDLGLIPKLPEKVVTPTPKPKALYDAQTGIKIETTKTEEPNTVSS